jgi:hypothetical protein
MIILFLDYSTINYNLTKTHLITTSSTIIDCLKIVSIAITTTIPEHFTTSCSPVVEIPTERSLARTIILRQPANVHRSASLLTTLFGQKVVSVGATSTVNEFFTFYCSRIEEIPWHCRFTRSNNTRQSANLGAGLLTLFDSCEIVLVASASTVEELFTLSSGLVEEITANFGAAGTYSSG